MKATLTSALILLATIVLSPEYVQAQRFSQEIKVSKQKAGVFLEFKQTEISQPSILEKDWFRDILEKTRGAYSTERRYWIGPNTTAALQTALRKVLTWADLNQTHQKEFEKEVTRIWVMRKETYLVYGYTQAFAEEVILNFNGHSDDSFECVLNFRSDGFEAHFNNKQEVSDFISLLSGKSVNKEIDDIFH